MPLTKMQTEEAKAARKAASERWAKMTPEEQAAAKKAARVKKKSDLTPIDVVATENMTAFDWLWRTGDFDFPRLLPKPKAREQKPPPANQQ